MLSFSEWTVVRVALFLFFLHSANIYFIKLAVSGSFLLFLGIKDFRNEHCFVMIIQRSLSINCCAFNPLSDITVLMAVLNPWIRKPDASISSYFPSFRYVV